MQHIVKYELKTKTQKYNACYNNWNMIFLKAASDRNEMVGTSV